MINVDQEVPKPVLDEIASLPSIISARLIPSEVTGRGRQQHGGRTGIRPAGRDCLLAIALAAGWPGRDFGTHRAPAPPILIPMRPLIGINANFPRAENDGPT